MVLFSLLQRDPILIFPWLLAIMIGLTIHEFAHGFSAYLLGDRTAESQGRLTLNPIAHIDPFGAIMLLIVGFGWAKPVPINIHQIRHGRLGIIIVSFAGVLFNFVFATLCILTLKYFVLIHYPIDNLLVIFLVFLVFINFALFIFNLLPIPPLDGYHIIEYFFPSIFLKYSVFMSRWGMFILLIVVFGTNIISYVISYFLYMMSLLFQINIISLINSAL